MQSLLAAKYELILAYMFYGDQLQDLRRDGLHKHFQEHIEEEREWAYQLAKKLSALGASVTIDRSAIKPLVTCQDIIAILNELLRLEQHSVEAWTQLSTQAHAQNDLALEGMAQDGAVIDQQHADDMRRYLRGSHA